MRPIRSFISFDIDDKAVLDKIVGIQNLLSKTGADLSLVRSENIHATIRFLGNIQPFMVEKIFDVMKEIQFTPFDVKINGVGAFPHLQHLRVIWAGMTKGADEMRNVVSQLEPRLRKLGFASDRKGFSPHLTIARIKSGRNKDELVKFIKANAQHEFGTVRVGCLKLKRSDLTPNGPIYSTLKEYCPS